MVSNTAVQFVTPATRVLLGLVLTGTLTRYLGIEGFGQYGLVFAYVAAFNGVFNDAGLSTITLREIARRPNERASLLLSGAALQACAALATYTLMIGSLLFVQYPSEVKLGAGLYGLVILYSPLDVLALPFQADLQLRRLVAPQLVSVILNFSLCMIVIWLGGPLQALIGAALLSLSAQYVWVTWLSLRLVPLHRRPARTHWPLLLREAWPMWLATMASTALQQAPALALSVFSIEAVGQLSAANRIPQQLLLIPFAIRGSTFPLLSMSWSTDRSRFVHILERLIRTMLLLAVPMAIFAISVAEPLVRLLFGSAFVDAAAPFALLSCAVALLFPGIIMGEAMIAAGKQQLNLAILTVTLLVLGGCLVWVAPRGDATGAAAAVLVANAVLVAGTFVIVARILGRSKSVQVLAPAAAGVLAGAAAVFVLGGLGTPLISAFAALVAFGAMAAVNPGMVRDVWAFSRQARSS
jgi:O-antigen/teichoic acid export membrane protein